MRFESGKGNGLHNFDWTGQVGAPAEEDLQNWGHHSSTSTVPDAVLQSIGQQHPDLVTFVFSCEVTRHPAIGMGACAVLTCAFLSFNSSVDCNAFPGGSATLCPTAARLCDSAFCVALT